MLCVFANIVVTFSRHEEIVRDIATKIGFEHISVRVVGVRICIWYIYLYISSTVEKTCILWGKGYRARGTLAFD